MKWAGGKGRLLGQLRPLLPPGVELRRHVEPFLGGGAMYFGLAPERALLSDINPSLVAMYEVVRDDADALIGALRRLAKGHSQTQYYEVREAYNGGGSRVQQAARFIYLNRTCFNGLHRVNRRGEFNVPFGRYKNPKIVDDLGLRAASAALQSAEIRLAGFEHVLGTAQPGDFVYFDPPYAPISETASFTSYCREGFGPPEQERLSQVFGELDRRGCRLMLSNSDVPAIRSLYRRFRIDTVAAPRAISCNARSRRPVREIVVRNY